MNVGRIERYEEHIDNFNIDHKWWSGPGPKFGEVMNLVGFYLDMIRVLREMIESDCEATELLKPSADEIGDEDPYQKFFGWNNNLFSIEFANNLAKELRIAAFFISDEDARRELIYGWRLIAPRIWYMRRYEVTQFDSQEGRAYLSRPLVREDFIEGQKAIAKCHAILTDIFGTAEGVEWDTYCDSDYGSDTNGEEGTTASGKQWNKSLVSQAIKKYLAEHSRDHSRLIAAMNSTKGRARIIAKTAARRLFGRNVIGRRLGIPPGSWRLIGDDSTWKSLARRFEIPLYRDRTRYGHQKIGMDMAIEHISQYSYKERAAIDQEEDRGNDKPTGVEDENVKKLLIKLEKSDPAFAEEAHRRLNSGSYSVEQQIELLETAIQAVSELREQSQ